MQSTMPVTLFLLNHRVLDPVPVGNGTLDRGFQTSTGKGTTFILWLE